MESDKEDIERPPFGCEHEEHVGNNKQDDTTNREQVSEDSVSTTDPWSDIENDGTSSKALDEPANSILIRTSEAVQLAAIKHQTVVSADDYYEIHELQDLMIGKYGNSQDVTESILSELKHVEKHMHLLKLHIEAQADDNKPLHQWAAFEGYPALSNSVSKLKQAMANFKAIRLPRDYLSNSVACAVDLSTSVSRASVNIFAAMSKKAVEYMDEMEASTLSDDSKAQANAIITGEVAKLIAYSTDATRTVWQAHDLLRECEQQPGNTKTWAWSFAATAMTAFVATVISLITIYLYGPAYFDMLPLRDGGHSMCSQVVDLVHHTRLTTNVTGQIYELKFRDIDSKYDALAALSEAHGFRIDGIVDSLGPPNQEGTYYMSASKSEDNSCERRIEKVSADLQVQLQRQQQELELVRKNMHRMDIRLTRGIEKARKE